MQLSVQGQPETMPLKNEKPALFGGPFQLVPKAGLEPARLTATTPSR